MIKIEENEIPKYLGPESFKVLDDLVLKVVQKGKNKKGAKGQGIEKFTFDDSKEMLVVIYFYDVTGRNKFDVKYEFYWGKEITDTILDRITEMKKDKERGGHNMKF